MPRGAAGPSYATIANFQVNNKTKMYLKKYVLTLCVRAAST